MELSSDERKLLGLTKRELLILKALEKLEGASMQELAEYLKLPRTSIYWPLTQMYGRNIVAYELAGKRKRWHSRVGELTFRRRLGALESVAGDMRIVEGVENIQALYLAAIDLHQTERVLILEGNLAVHTVARKMGIPFMLTWHAEAKKRKIILESIVGEDTVAAIDAGKIHRDVIQSLAQIELWIGYVVPDSFIHTDVALVLFRDVAIVVDWDTGRAIVINTPETVRLIRSFAEGFKEIGRKIDIAGRVRSMAKRM